MNVLLAILPVFVFYMSDVKAHYATLCVSLCPPCTEERIAKSNCSSLSNCPNKVKEPGCGCCLACAVPEGERCGLRLPECGPGLKCYGRNGVSTLSAILTSSGVCQRVKDTGLRKATTRRLRSSRRSDRKKNKNLRKRFRRHPHHGLLAPLNHEGPCSLHYEQTMTSCEALEQSVWFPSCDNNGYYYPKQCMTSYRHSMGECWCVNQIGEQLKNTWTLGPLSCKS